MPKTILVIEDEATQLLLLTLRLQERGYRVLSAMDGDEGLRKAMEEHPDLIVLDLVLPGLSGLEVHRRLQAHEATRAIPILVVTASRLRHVLAERGMVDVDRCLAKPYQLSVLVEKIADTLQAPAAAVG
ncbi:MAG: response regulator [Candidatus Omnitrophica bacterium]|nr:response regulator [Candidatus Omnitrophota bacterium]